MRNDCIISETVKHGRREYTIKLWHDPDCEDPLTNDEGVFITHDKGSRANYGNEPCSEEEHEQIGRRIELYLDPEGAKATALAKALRDDDEDEELGEPLIGLPVYVYEHGQVSMRTRAFSCPWDSGQSGFIYITEKTALSWQGGKRMTKAKLANVLKSLESVVETYGQWCNGETYFYTVEDETGEQVDDIGCGGYIGHEYAIEEAKRDVEHHHKARVKEACAKRIAATVERIERLAWSARGVMTV